MPFTNVDTLERPEAEENPLSKAHGGAGSAGEWATLFGGEGPGFISYIGGESEWRSNFVHGECRAYYTPERWAEPAAVIEIVHAPAVNEHVSVFGCLQEPGSNLNGYQAKVVNEGESLWTLYLIRNTGGTAHILAQEEEASAPPTALELSVKAGVVKATFQSLTIEAPDSTYSTGYVGFGGTGAIGMTSRLRFFRAESQEAVHAPVVSSVSPTEGSTAGGTTVTVHGEYLTGATAVKFGTTPATGVHVVSASELTCTSPAHAAGTVDVRVTTAGGQSAISSADHFTYVLVAPLSFVAIVRRPSSFAVMVVDP
jgi:hypothetical protein